MGQASGHYKMMPQSNRVPEHPSSVGKGAGECDSLAQGWEEDLDAAVSGSQGGLPAIKQYWCP